VELVLDVKTTPVHLLDHLWKTVASPQFGPVWEHPRAGTTATELESLRDRMSQCGGWVGACHPTRDRALWERFAALCCAQSGMNGPGWRRWHSLPPLLPGPLCSPR
jgi:hypothetical protein